MRRKIKNQKQNEEDDEDKEEVVRDNDGIGKMTRKKKENNIVGKMIRRRTRMM